MTWLKVSLHLEYHGKDFRNVKLGFYTDWTSIAQLDLNVSRYSTDRKYFLLDFTSARSIGDISAFEFVNEAMTITTKWRIVQDTDDEGVKMLGDN